jgi:D-alanine-D-alanine ligase
MNKPKVAVVLGGPSREHEISLKSGEAVLTELKRNGYPVHKTYISLTGDWVVDDGERLSSIEAVNRLNNLGVEVFFLAVHGTFGEDGTLQALLERLGMKFTGSGASASILAMDKVTSSDIFAANGMLVPPMVTFSRYELIRESKLRNQIKQIKYPLIVKPASQGSSLGVTLVESDGDLPAAIEFALEHDNKIIVQQYIKGREVSCGVLEDAGSGKLTALPPTELTPKGADFFDYYAKYTENATDEITPPEMSEKKIDQIQNIAVNAHKLLGCAGYSRTDMIVKGDNIFVIETNTLPGLTSTSILPQQAAASDISLGKMLDDIITCALKKSV